MDKISNYFSDFDQWCTSGAQKFNELKKSTIYSILIYVIHGLVLKCQLSDKMFPRDSHT